MLVVDDGGIGLGVGVCTVDLTECEGIVELGTGDEDDRRKTRSFRPRRRMYSPPNAHELCKREDCFDCRSRCFGGPHDRSNWKLG